MQIIQTFLGNQVNNLGQKSYLGLHHQILSQPKSTSIHDRHNNFIKPLVISKPLVSPSRLFIAGKRQPFIDTLITDNDLGSLDIDTDFPSIEMETYNFNLPENNTNQITDINANLGNISNIIQTQIAGNVNNDIFPEITTPQKPKTTRKKTTQKTTTQKTPTSKSPKKSTTQKTTTKKPTKSSTSKKSKQLINENVINNLPSESLLETNLLSSEHPQPEIINFSENYPASQTQINPVNSPIFITNNIDIAEPNTSPTDIISSELENESNLPLQRTIDDLAISTNDIINVDSNIIEQETEFEFSDINNNQDLTIDNSSTYSNQETQVSHIQENETIENSDIFSDLNINQPIIDAETSASGNILDVPTNDNTFKQDTENSNITQIGKVKQINIDINNIAAAPVNLVPAENQLNRDISRDVSANTNLDKLSDSLPENEQLVSNINNSNIAENNPSTSETITPTADPSTSSTQQESIFADPSFENSAIENQTASTSDTSSFTNKNTIAIPQELNTVTNTDNLLSESDVLNIQPDLLAQVDPTITTKSNIITPDSLSLNVPNHQESTIVPKPENQSEITTSEINQTQLQNIESNTSNNTENLTSENLTSEITENSPVVTPSLSSATPSATTTSEINPIQLQNIESNTSNNIENLTSENITSEITENSPVITPSLFSATLSETTTSEINPIQLQNIESNTSNNTENLTSENLTSEITENSPVITPSLSSATPSATTTSEFNPIQRESTTSSTSNNSEKITSNDPISQSSIFAPSEQLDQSESTIITPESDDLLSPNITDNLPIFRNIINNEPVTTPESNVANLGFENLNLSDVNNNTDSSENLSPQDNENKENNQENTSGIDTELNNLLNKLPVPQGYATGGQVTTTSVENHHPVAPSDTVPAMLTPGEFVINAKDAQKNIDILKHINTGGSPEEIISPSLEVSTTKTPETDIAPSTTKVDSFVDSTLQRKEAQPNTSSEPTGLTSPSLGVEIGKQRLSLVNTPQINTAENTTNTVSETAPHYSSPSLIFRKANSHTNTQTPSQWSSIEELLNGSDDQFSNFNFSGSESRWQNSPSSHTASSSTSSQIFSQSISTPQGFAHGGEVAPPDILRDVAPITETINSPYSSSPTVENNNNNNESNQNNGEQGDNKDDDAKLEALAQEIYYRLRQRIEIEKERQGKYVGRLPW